MLRQEQIEETTTPVGEYGVARTAALTDPRVETFLNKKLGPITGTVSYHERLQMRDELRQEIESRAAAHMELGSAREQAIGNALASLDTPVSETHTQPLPARTKAVRAIAGTRSLVPALWAFGGSALGSLLLVLIGRTASGSDASMLLTLMLIVFPLIAGMRLGSRGTQRPLKGLLLAQAALYLPVTLAFTILLNYEGAGGLRFGEMAFWTAIYFSVSTMVGGVGVHTGKWLKKKITNRRGKFRLRP